MQIGKLNNPTQDFLLSCNFVSFRVVFKCNSRGKATLFTGRPYQTQSDVSRRYVGVVSKRVFCFVFCFCRNNWIADFVFTSLNPNHVLTKRCTSESDIDKGTIYYRYVYLIVNDLIDFSITSVCTAFNKSIIYVGNETIRFRFNTQALCFIISSLWVVI